MLHELADEQLVLFVDVLDVGFLLLGVSGLLFDVLSGGALLGLVFLDGVGQLLDLPLVLLELGLVELNLFLLGRDLFLLLPDGAFELVNLLLGSLALQVLLLVLLCELLDLLLQALEVRELLVLDELRGLVTFGDLGAQLFLPLVDVFVFVGLFIFQLLRVLFLLGNFPLHHLDL